ncbi:MAG: SoxR reducing system RseC family protein [Bacteroidales bacterium]|jgi:sigma-E factor negative regulatory protein RseC|nr:SoxR reducing system RseC family protein [Bacteroidales bacterium]
MPQGEIITHEGKVLRVPGNGTAEVEILVSEGCAGCHAKSVCSAGKSDTKVIMARSKSSLRPGDRVTVEMKLSQGFRALAIGYILPFVVLIAAFVVTMVAGAGELLSALLSFAAVGGYYLVIWLLRVRIGEKFEFNIKV